MAQTNKSKIELKRPSLIAEIGCNFAGSLDRAKFLSRLAIESGADYLKYQFFTGKNLINSKYYSKVLNIDANEVIKTINSIQLTFDQYENLFNFNEENSFNFGVSFFSLDDAMEFFEKRNFANFKTFSFIKIASGEVTDLPLLKYIADINKKLRLPIIISTGISSDKEIKKTLSFFNKKLYGIYLLHCIVEYPVETKILNLNRIKVLAKKFKVDAGFSDHSLSIIPSIISLFFGAKVIEKHFTDSRENKTADNPISMMPSEFIEIKNVISNYNNFYGTGNLIISQKEFKELTYARKGLYAAKKISKGSLLTPSDICSLRPNLGFNDAKIYFKLINKKSKKDIEEGEPLSLNDFS